MACGTEGDELDAPSKDEHLEPEAISEAYAVLSKDEKLKLLAIDGRLRGGTSYGRGELLREALTRALLGRRRCPVTVPFMAFMIETMRSVASHDRDRLKRESSFDGLDEAEIERGVLTGAKPATPEEQAMNSQKVEAIHAHFDGDEQAGLLLLGWAADMRGKDLREFIGVDQAELDYLIKRVRRAVVRLYPEGFHA